MKIFKYFLSLPFVFCGCADATTKNKVSELSCPYILPAESDFPTSWVTLGKVTGEKVQLREIGIIDGNATKEKIRISEAKERMFTDDIVDEWETFSDRSEALVEYDAKHSEKSLKCTYGKTIAESNDIYKNVVLLIPLPDKKPVSCLLVRRDIDPKYEISCNVK